MTIRPKDDGVAVHRDGVTEFVVFGAVRRGQLGGLRGVGPAGVGLDEDVSRADIGLVGVVAVGVDVAPGLPNHDGVAVHGHGVPEPVVDNFVGGGQHRRQSGLAIEIEGVPVGPASGASGLDEYVRRADYVFVGVVAVDVKVVPGHPNHDGIAVQSHGVPEGIDGLTKGRCESGLPAPGPGNGVPG